MGPRLLLPLAWLRLVCCVTLLMTSRLPAFLTGQSQSDGGVHKGDLDSNNFGSLVLGHDGGSAVGCSKTGKTHKVPI